MRRTTEYEISLAIILYMNLTSNMTCLTLMVHHVFKVLSVSGPLET